MKPAHDQDAEHHSKPVALTIAGLDPSGGAGLLADTKTFAALGCFPTAVLTSITFQNTTGVFGVVHQSPEVVRGQLEPVLSDYKISALKTGMLPTPAVVDEIAKIVDENKLTNLVVDPVLVATSGQDLIGGGAFAAIKAKLLPRCLIITPNIPEAEQLVGFPITSLEQMHQAATAIKRLGARNVLVKGGHLGPLSSEVSKRDMVDLFLDEAGTFLELRDEFLPVGEVHGSGCVLSAAITAHLAHGLELIQAVRNAKSYITNAIGSAPRLGHGARPL